MRIQRVWTMQVSLLVLGLLSLMISFSSAQDVRYHNLVNKFINDYNRNEGSENLFRLSILNLEPGKNNDPGLLMFTIKETVCPKTENTNPNDCDFKENGVVKECIGSIAMASTQPSVDASCARPENIKKLRVFEKFKNFLKRAGDKIKNTIKNAINNLFS